MNAQELRSLGWKPAFQQQLTIEEERECLCVRVGAHLGSQVLCLTASDEMLVPTALTQSCGELAVGDWMLLEPKTHRGVRRLERESLLARKAAGQRAETQSIAANLDTLFIVSSCNHDFNPSRLERYLSLAVEASVTPVVVLSKADLCEDPIVLQHDRVRLENWISRRNRRRA